MSEYIDTIELDRLIRRKRRLWGCRLIRIEVRTGGLMEYAYHCSDAIHEYRHHVAYIPQPPGQLYEAQGIDNVLFVVP